MFNGVTETSFTKFVSPADTEWAVGSLADYATLTYTDWTTAGGGNPVHTYVGEQFVVHLISDDIYLSLQFTDLPAGPGFSYIRSTPTPADVPPTVAITSPTNGASFTAPAIVPITATASDSDGSVTNVAFFDGATLLGRDQQPALHRYGQPRRRQPRAHRGGHGQPRPLHHFCGRERDGQCREHAAQRDHHQPG